MVQFYKRRIYRSGIHENVASLDILEALEDKLSHRKAAKKYNSKPAALQHRIKKVRKNIDENPLKFSSKYTANKISFYG